MSNNNEFTEYNEPKRPSNQLNFVLGILGVLFAISVIYFHFNKKEVNKDVLIRNVEVNYEQPILNQSQNNSNTKNDVSEQEYHEPISQDELINFVAQYYNDISRNNFLAENYFSDDVLQYINRKNINPHEINSILKNNNDFINGKSKIINNEINFKRSEGEISYYNYWVDFICYRKSKNNYQSCKVKVEIGIDERNRIKSYKELEVTDLKFTTSLIEDIVIHHHRKENSNQYELGNYVINGDEKEKEYFHNEPDVSTKRRAFLVKGENVYVQKIQNGFGYVGFTNPEGQTSNGWLIMDELMLQSKIIQ